MLGRIWYCSDRGGTGRRAGLRILWGNPWGFESLRSHPKSPRMTTLTERHLLGAYLLGATLVACHSTAREDAVLATRVPVARLDSVLRAADNMPLPLADARALLEVAPAIGVAATPPHDTMASAAILAWGRTERTRRR